MNLNTDCCEFVYPNRENLDTAMGSFQYAVAALGEPIDGVCHWNYECLCACSVIRLDSDCGVLIPVNFLCIAGAICMLDDIEMVDGDNCATKDLLSVDEIANLEDIMRDRLVRKYERVLCSWCRC